MSGKGFLSSDKDFLSFEYRLPGGGMVRQTINRALLPKEMDDEEMQKLLRIITEEAAERGGREENEACAKLTWPHSDIAEEIRARLEEK